jgi:FkbM family methyltransferase
MKKLKFFLFKSFKKIETFLWGKGLGKIPFFYSIYKLAYKLITPRSLVLTKVYDNLMYVYPRDEGLGGELIARGYYHDEKYMTELFIKSIKPGSIVVDVGANIGYYTLIAAKLAGKKGKVYSFEPEDKNFDILMKNIETNKYDNVIAIKKGVSDTNGKKRLYINKFNLGKHSLSSKAMPKREQAGFLEIETVTLDVFFNKLANKEGLDVIKIDTEGSEGLVLNGAKNLLKRKKLKIFTEFSPWTRNTGIDPLVLLNTLKKYGFAINVIDEKEKCLRKIDTKKIIEMCDKKENNTGAVNLLLEK